MARRAVAEGITHILATPFYKNKRWTNEKELINQQVKVLQQELDSRAVSLTIFHGQEVGIVGELVEVISEKNIVH